METAVFAWTIILPWWQLSAVSKISAMSNYTGRIDNNRIDCTGHVFCQECLELSLRTSEKRQGDGRKAQCPSCRKPIVRKKAKEVIQIKFIDKKKFEAQKEQHNRRKKRAITGGDVEC